MSFRADGSLLDRIERAAAATPPSERSPAYSVKRHPFTSSRHEEERVVIVHDEPARRSQMLALGRSIVGRIATGMQVTSQEGGRERSKQVERGTTTRLKRISGVRLVLHYEDHNEQIIP